MRVPPWWLGLFCLPLVTGAMDYWLGRRQAMIHDIWGAESSLPTKSHPDYLLATNVSDLTELVWDLSDARFPLNSSVFYKVKATGKRARRAFILHHGHSTAPDPSGTWWDHYNMSGFLADLADADVFVVSMPLYGCNQQHGYPSNHAWFEQWETPGNSPHVNSSSTLRYFLDPVIMTVNYILGELGYEEVHMTGKSGGGWTTTLIAALDARIQVTIPDAGSLPLDFNHTSWEYEQLPIRGSLYARCGYTCMYVLAGLEAGRTSIQVLHENDPCCFRGAGRHPQILEYNAQVQQVLQGYDTHGWMSTAIVDWDKHEYSPRDREVISHAWTAAIQGLPVSAFAELPCDILRAAALPCPI